MSELLQVENLETAYGASQVLFGLFHLKQLAHTVASSPR